MKLSKLKYSLNDFKRYPSSLNFSIIVGNYYNTADVFYKILIKNHNIEMIYNGKRWYLYLNIIK